MNAIPEGPTQVAASRFARGVGVAAVTTILVVGLAGCMTGRVSAGQIEVKQNPPVPAGVELGQPADRIAEHIERIQRAPREVHLPSWTDRIAAQAEYEANRPPEATDRFRGVPADRVEELLAQDEAAAADRFEGMTADRIVEAIDREFVGMRAR
jgi:hypothetical protein